MLIHEKAFAKINTHLRILSRREDGYHELSMCMVPISLADELEFSLLPHGKIEFICEALSDEGMKGENNLVVRAARALQPYVRGNLGARIKLKKNIPAGAGLGGASSDAATTLLSLKKLWDIEISQAKLEALALGLGADVPFFLHKKPAKITGIGEKIVFLSDFPEIHLVLIYPGVHVSTPLAYQLFDEQKDGCFQLTAAKSAASLPQLFRAFTGVCDFMENDFEEVVFERFRGVREAHEMLSELGASHVLMSGSGSSVFALFEKGSEAQSLYQKLIVRKKDAWQVYCERVVT